MKKLIYFFSVLIVILSACNDECQGLLDEVHSAKSTFENAPTAANCVAYQAALTNYLNSSCEGGSGVNYDNIFQSYLDDLQCDTFPNTLPSCSDGIQNGDETGIDCGGSCTPCSSSSNELFIEFDMNSTHYDFRSTMFNSNANSSYVSGQITFEPEVYWSSIGLELYNWSGNFDLADYQSIVGISYPFEAGSSATSHYADFDFELTNGGIAFDTYDAGNTSTNSAFTITSAEIFNSQIILGDTIESYKVEGNFHCKMKDDSGNVYDATNGLFRLIFPRLD